MPTHAEQRVLPYSQDQLFDLVADVERYPEFLPWCVGARIRKQLPDGTMEADLVIGFKMFRERFASIVKPDGAHYRIDVSYVDGPFRYLNNHWKFIAEGENRTRVDFFVDFEFKSALLQKVIGVLFNEAVRRMVAAFETRAKQLYGRGAS
jgi:coenzyme Q-binding protein COQ10